MARRNGHVEAHPIYLTSGGDNPNGRRSASWSTARSSTMPRLMPASSMCSTDAMKPPWPKRARVAESQGARLQRELLATR